MRELQTRVQSRKVANRSTSLSHPAHEKVLDPFLESSGKSLGSKSVGVDQDLGRKKHSCVLEVTLTLIGLAITSLAAVLFIREMFFFFQSVNDPMVEVVNVLAHVAFLGICLFLIYGSLLYQLTRIGYFSRLRKHRIESRQALETIFSEAVPPKLAILIPSYKEELSTVVYSLFSSALQEYPCREIVLLIDDPPKPNTQEDERALVNLRQLPSEIEQFLQSMSEKTTAWLADFKTRTRADDSKLEDESWRLLERSLEVADWFQSAGQSFKQESHTDRLFVQLTFEDRAQVERKRAQNVSLELRNLPPGEVLPRLNHEYLRLERMFSTRIHSFERKKYHNLSHEPNKAMNINSYIGLMGGAYEEVFESGKCILKDVRCDGGGQYFQPAEFILTLDADSLLVSDYSLRLVHQLRREEHRRTAVIQTPYSAVPNPPGATERIAGATTDIQYSIHQGFTGFGATFWVGANAILRRAALDDIATYEQKGKYTIKRYIQDTTVIEDTESSVDLINAKWSLLNYPRRLSYSATPPDLGSLLIQRRRWANGGLIILPKLLKYALKNAGRLRVLPEFFMRFHYLTSLFAMNVGVIVLLIYPFEETLRIVWLPLTAAPYVALYGRDLRFAGYRFADVFRVYALNLVLIPINLAGVFQSLRQMCTGKKSPFGRTPKIRGRTPYPFPYLFFNVGFAAYCLAIGTVDVLDQRWFHAAFAGSNAVLLWYGIIRFVGIQDFLGIGGQIGSAPSKQLISPRVTDETA